jgi:FtsH-binding integral membrane protein
MDQPERKPLRGLTLALDAGLTLAVFVFFTWILRSHVPSSDPFHIWLWAAVTASCLAALFWLALQMFRAVLRAQLEAKRKDRQ